MTSVTSRHVVLIGLPGAGKSTVGRAVADRISRPFFDIDTLIERSFNMTVAGVFAAYGEPAFRDREVRLSEELALGPAAIIAPGGGWAGNPEAVAHLRPYSRIIYLRVSPVEAIRRMRHGIARRPLLARAADPELALRELHARRDSVYTECADMILDTRGAGRSQVVSRVVAAIMAAESEIEG